ncbi:hypothetical protein HBI81_256430 [Parastagonospora nodorum]|nr:hypothetical protein HBI18_241170 [Parastagonospora nodorum]KAH6510770.1 hypothetical protein HBI81_256430 [Parastagonospora nodorum]
MLSAVWLLRQSLPASGITDRVWAQLAQAAACVELNEGAATPRKRARRASDADDTEPRADDAAPGAVDAEADAVATVTNHNRRAEQQRKLRLAKAAERRQESLGLVAPGSQAPVAERNAHQSITPTDETEVAWIVKQPTTNDTDFFHTAKLPYATACTMLQYARAVGNDAAKVHASYFVDNWRRSGHALLLADASRPSATPARRSNFNILIEAVSQCESMTATTGIGYRWALARMGQIYHDEIARIQREDDAAGMQPGRREGKGQIRTQAKKALWDRYRPDVHNRLTWSAFKVRLKRAQRWTEAATQLGWGFLLLIPTSMITPHWVEQTLRPAEWGIWLQLVNRVYPDAVQASRDFDEWAGPLALQDGSIEDAGRLPLEARLHSRIQEVRDSDDEGDKDDSEDEYGSSQHVASSQQGVLADSITSVQSLSLRALFQPVRN